MPIKTGDRVRMTEEFKTMMSCLRGPFGKHQGPFISYKEKDGIPKDNDDPENDCLACSSDHIDEFGTCEGIVGEKVSWNNNDSVSGPEWNVRWLPSNLRYAYHPDHLVVVSVGGCKVCGGTCVMGCPFDQGDND